MLACDLALRGVAALVVERSPQQRQDAVGMAVNALVVELLTERDLMAELEDDGVGLPFAHFAQLWVDPARLTEPHPANFVIPQRRLEEVLAQRAVKLGAQVLRGVTVTGAAQDGRGVDVLLDDGSAPRRVRAGWLVGCDGRHSTVRQAAGIGFDGSESPFYGLVGDVEVEDGDVLYEAYGAHEHPAGLFAVSPSGPGVLRVTTGLFGVEPPDRHAPADARELRACMERVAGLRGSTGRPLWLSRWFDVTRLADRYRRDRILLAGDAAHVHFPLSGHGLGTGLEDAVNLGWKLAAQVRGSAPEGLLDSYEAERRPAGARACQMTRAQVALLHPLEAVAPLRAVIRELIAIDAVNEYFVRSAGGLDGHYPMGLGGSPAAGDDPLVGRRLPHHPLRTPAGDTDVGATLRGGRAVLLDLSGGPAPEPPGWADRLDVVAAAPLPDLDARAVLLRPDGRVAWVGRGQPDEAGLHRALAAWLGAPN
jgi:2-polyprenyl-6-methoxyphenol hydroxylase-like FAD-dependent oxidoreductase